MRWMFRALERIYALLIRAYAAIAISFAIGVVASVLRIVLPDASATDVLTSTALGGGGASLVIVFVFIPKVNRLRRDLGIYALIPPLVQLSYMLDAEGHRLGDTTRVGPILVQLENCARIVEGGRSTPKSRDRQTDRALRGESRAMAAAFRSWKMWALKPGPLTRGDLAFRVNAAILGSATGNRSLLLAATDGDGAVAPKCAMDAVRAIVPVLVALAAVVILRSVGIEVDSFVLLMLLLPAFAISALLPDSTALPNVLEGATNLMEKLGVR